MALDSAKESLGTALGADGGPDLASVVHQNCWFKATRIIVHSRHLSGHCPKKPPPVVFQDSALRSVEEEVSRWGKFCPSVVTIMGPGTVSISVESIECTAVGAGACFDVEIDSDCTEVFCTDESVVRFCSTTGASEAGVVSLSLLSVDCRRWRH